MNINLSSSALNIPYNQTPSIQSKNNKYTGSKGGGNIDKYKIINETESNGFKVISCIEKLPEDERIERDNQLAQKATKVLQNYYKRINNKK